MFIIEVVVGGVVVLECIILKGGCIGSHKIVQAYLMKWPVVSIVYILKAKSLSLSVSLGQITEKNTEGRSCASAQN